MYAKHEVSKRFVCVNGVFDAGGWWSLVGITSFLTTGQTHDEVMMTCRVEALNGSERLMIGCLVAGACLSSKVGVGSGLSLRDYIQIHEQRRSLLTKTLAYPQHHRLFSPRFEVRTQGAKLSASDVSWDPDSIPSASE